MSTQTIDKEKAYAKLTLKDIAALSKLRLATLVVMSAAFCFVMASKNLDLTKLCWLVIGGFLVTAASNGFNQIIERDLDKLMSRTRSRPLPSGSMQVSHAMMISCIMSIFGVGILWVLINPLSGLLGALALVLYTFVYTPLKQKTPLAVFVGAIPGAIPPMLGWVAVSGEMSFEALLMFAIQFVWQFPHFWAIAWVLDDDYKKAGFRLLPSTLGRDQSSAFQILIYTICLLPVSLTPLVFHLSGNISAIIIVIANGFFIAQAVKLFKTCEIKSAQQLMFGSFIYLPVVQIALMLDKI